MNANDLFRVAGLSTVVTGGASGIGLAYAEIMAENGADLTILDIDGAGLAAVVGRLRDAGGQVEGVCVDLRDKAETDAAMAGVIARAGRLDVLFANAGISGGAGFLGLDGSRPAATAFENLPAELWDRVTSMNLGSMVNTIQAALPHMKRQGSGSIITTSSCSATKVEIFVSSAYVVSKAAVAHLTRQLAIEVAAYGVRVNAIAPGPMATNIAGGRLKDPANQQVFARYAPLGRVGDPNDLKGAALLLASPASRHMTGAEILVDGGVTLGPPQ